MPPLQIHTPLIINIDANLRSKVDDVFFVVFPIMFLVFNLIYWPMCLSRQHGSAPASMD